MPVKLMRPIRQHVQEDTGRLDRVGETQEAVRMPQDTGPTAAGRRLGGDRQSAPTPPRPKSRSKSQSSDLPFWKKDGEKTPPPKAQVADWLMRLDTDQSQPSEGMFGPYDSQPPTRGQSVHEPTVPAPRHPFAYTHSTVPFSALQGGPDMGATKHLAGQARRPESDVLSRGAGMKWLSRPKDAVPGAGLVGGGTGADTPGSRESPGMGTFGREASQEAIVAQPVKPSSPRKAVPPLGTQILEVPCPATSKARSTADTIRPDPGPKRHIHHPHHDYPFSLGRAAQRQTEALQAAEEKMISKMLANARTETLARLEAAQATRASSQALHEVPAEAPRKGPRVTYDTMTSGPSFGHIWHRDGMPVSRQVSMQPDPRSGPHRMPQMSEMPTRTGGSHNSTRGEFVPIPFGVPMGATIPRPMMIRFDSSGAAIGIGLQPDLAGLGGMADQGVLGGDAGFGRQECEQRRDDRSAYVETVEDEQEPTVPAAQSFAAKSRYDTRSKAAETMPTESPRTPKTVSKAAESRGNLRGHQFLPQDAPPSKPASTASNAPSVKAMSTGSTAKAPSLAPKPPQKSTNHETAHLLPSAMLHSVQASTPLSQRLPSFKSDMPEQGSAVPKSPSIGPPDYGAPTASIAPTTASNVKHMVCESRFHDEVLCQLLDAARLNLIGDEAKKALNRAARARVIELKELKDKGELEMGDLGLPSSTKDKKGKKHKRGGRKSGSQDRSHKARSERVEPTTPPQWAQEMMQHLVDLTDRVDGLHNLSGENPQTDHGRFLSQDTGGDLIDDLVFDELRSSVFGPDLHGMPAFDLAAVGLPGIDLLRAGSSSCAPNSGAYIRTMSPSERPRDTQGDLSWGSEVELPRPDEMVDPPKTPLAPTINIQAPTESNVDKSQRAVTPSQAGRKTPKGKTVEVDAPEVLVQDGPARPHAPSSSPSHGALPDPRDRDLPPPPPESIRSNRSSPAPDSAPHRARLPTHSGSATQQYGIATQRGSPGSGDTPISMREALGSPWSAVPPPQIDMPQTMPPLAYPVMPQATSRSTSVRPSITQASAGPSLQMPPKSHSNLYGQTQVDSDPFDAHTAYKTAYQELPPAQSAANKGKSKAMERVDSMVIDPAPWDLVAQRLYSWAMVWEEKTFVDALADISLGRQVDEFALTIITMVTFKRMIRKNLSETPQRPCDKMFVPPTIADSINKAVHSKNVKAAAQMLEENWWPYKLKNPPRIIIALTRHRDERDHWTAHRFDLSSGNLRSYSVTHQRSSLSDGRPYRWWNAIRMVFGKHYNMPEIETPQRVETVETQPEAKDDNSLLALNYARNLFVGYRPEAVNKGLINLREVVWGEVRSLADKKRKGALVVDMDSPNHVDEL